MNGVSASVFDKFQHKKTVKLKKNMFVNFLEKPVAIESINFLEL